MSVFCSSRWVAKLCLSVCGFTRFLIPAIATAAWKARPELAGRHRQQWVAAGEQPYGWPGDAIPVTEQFEEPVGQLGEAVLAALALLDPKQHPPGVDVGHLEVGDLGDPQAGTVRRRQRRLILRPRRRLQHVGDLLQAEDDGDLPRLADEHQRAGERRAGRG